MRAASSKQYTKFVYSILFRLLEVAKKAKAKQCHYFVQSELSYRDGRFVAIINLKKKKGKIHKTIKTIMIHICFKETV